MLIQELKDISSTKKDIRNFALTMGGVLFVIAFLLMRQGNDATIPLVLGALLLVCGFLLPEALKPLQRAWMGLAVLLGFVMSRLILTIVFFGVITPTALIALLVRKKFLDLEFDKDKKSYWKNREADVKPEDYERQY